MIEIEKKFLLTQEQQENLLADATDLGAKLVEDSYFDTESYSLTTNDFWLRLRDGEYELKAPLKSGNNSPVKTNRYNEITDHAEIARELNIDTMVDLKAALSEAGISAFMTCYTSRHSYEKQGFHVDVDTATYLDSDFTYAVAEIELLIDSEEEADAADQRIVAFAKTFGLTTDQVINGKIVSFIKARRPEHYAALAEAWGL